MAGRRRCGVPSRRHPARSPRRDNTPGIRSATSHPEKQIVFGARACATGAMQTLRVLVIEDDALIVMLLAEVLKGMGHDVCATAATEAEAVSAAARHRPDLMIVDAGLGHGSGVAAVEEILRAGPVAHLFLSGDAGRVQTRRPDAIVVRKPFRQAELARAIDTALAAGPGTI